MEISDIKSDKQQSGENARFVISWKTYITVALISSALFISMALLAVLTKHRKIEHLDVLIAICGGIALALVSLLLEYASFKSEKWKEKKLHDFAPQLSSYVENLIKPGEMILGETLIEMFFTGFHLIVLTKERLLWIKVKKNKERVYPYAANSLSMRDIIKADIRPCPNFIMLNHLCSIKIPPERVGKKMV